MTETQQRFLKAIAERVPDDKVTEWHFEDAAGDLLASLGAG